MPRLGYTLLLLMTSLVILVTSGSPPQRRRLRGWWVKARSVEELMEKLDYDPSQPRYFDHLYDAEYVDDRYLDFYWVPTKPGQPSLRAVYIKSENGTVRAIPCGGTHMAPYRLRPALGDFVRCRLEVGARSEGNVELVPTTRACNHDDLSDACPLDHTYHVPHHLPNQIPVNTYEFERKFLERAPRVVAKERVDANLWRVKFELDHLISGHVTFRLDELVGEEGNQRWQEIYRGRRRRVLVQGSVGRTSTFRGLMTSDGDEITEEEHIVWSNPSEILTITF